MTYSYDPATSNYNDIEKILTTARVRFDYVKFAKNRKYIIIAFERDRSVIITTNHHNTSMWIEMESIMNYPSISRVIEFLLKWLSII